MPPYLQAYVEIPIDRRPGAARRRRSAGRAGEPRSAPAASRPTRFPPPADLVRFLRACAAAGVPFKATAGLHHPLRAEYRLTYEPDSARGTMFGFLNLFLAAAFMAGGHGRRRRGAAAGGARPPRRSASTTRGVEWRGQRLDLDAIRRAREAGIVSFGSCSFTEPIDDLQSLGLL